jgi:GDPmannose 4,6-dehydratase
MKTKTALITGVTGQDGAYLSELLLNKGYTVHGIKRRTSLINTDRIDHLYNNPSFHLHYGDLTDSLNVVRLIKETQPDEIYNLGAMSHVKVSFELPEYTANVDGLGLLRILESVRTLGMENKTRIYQASTSELFGNAPAPQNEQTQFQPQSPYACAKLFAYWTAINYREAYDMFVCNGVLFNHESPLRGETFVTRKITRAVARISMGLQDCLELGNLDAIRDFGHAKDYVNAMWLMMQQDKPHDLVIATGQMTSVRQFVKMAFNTIGVDLLFSGTHENEIGVLKCSGKIVVKINPKYYRPTEVEILQGDATKAKRLLGWKQEHTLESMIKEMVKYDLMIAENEYAKAG